MKSHSLPAVIAVVDDDESVRLAIASLLRSCGWTVCTFASGGELLAGIDESKFCLVVADVQMPEMDGFALVRKLAVRTIMAGAVGFFTKPLDDVLFLFRVAEIAGTAPR
jgi:FixJ family two-component response regulator